MIPLLFAISARAETSLSVEQAVALAVSNNPNLESADLARLVAEVRESRARLDRFTGQVGASGAAQAGATRPWGGPTNASSELGWSATATASVPLYTGVRVDASIDAARLAVDLAETDLVLTRRDLVRATYTAYWTLKGIELQIAAQQEGLEATRQALEIIQSKADNGLAAGIDVNRSTVDLLAQEESLVAQRAARVQARQQLVQLLAIDDQELTLVSEPPRPAEGGVVLPADPLAARPEILRQGLAVDQAQANVRLARSAALPTLAVTGTATALAGSTGGASAAFPTLATLIEPDPISGADLVRPTVDLTVGLTVSWNPFDLLRTRQNVQASKLQVQQVEAVNVSERLRLSAEVRSAAAQVDALRARFPLVDRQVALARDNQDIVRDLYAQGSATILDLFNAQSAFRAAAIQEASLLVNLATAELDYRWLLGEEPIEIPPIVGEPR